MILNKLISAPDRIRDTYLSEIIYLPIDDHPQVVLGVVTFDFGHRYQAATTADLGDGVRCLVGVDPVLIKVCMSCNS
jgi:hypothetical protein